MLALQRGLNWVQLAIAPAVFGTLVVLVGTSYGEASFYVSGRYTAVALNTSAATFLLCAGIVAANGRRGVMKLLSDQGAAGLVTRRLCPAAILVPAIVGWLRVWGEKRGMFSTEFGVSMLSVANIVTFTGLVWWSARFLRQADKDLRASTRRYAFMADAMPQIVWTALPDGAIDYYNVAWYEYTGMTDEQARDLGWKPVLHPDDVERCAERWKRSLATGEPYEIEYRFKRASDGVYRWHLGRALPQRNDRGVIIHWVGTCTDIDDQKQAEERSTKRVEERTTELSKANAELKQQMEERERIEKTSELIFDNSLDVICTIDEQGCFAQVSHASENVWGYRPQELIGKPYMAFVHPDDHERTAREAAAIMAGRPAKGFENRYVRCNGAIVPILWTANWSDVDRMMYCVGRDISEQERANEELQKAKEVAEAASRAKSRFLATMSHEIRTPMNGVIGMTNLLLETRLSAEQRDFADTIRASAENLLAIINDILDFSKIEAGKLTIEVLDFDLREVVEGTVDLLAEAAQAKGLELAALVDPTTPVRLRGDANRLRQVLVNLVGNAIKFTPKGEVAVRVSLESETESSATLGFRITDTGIGIEETAQTKIFEAFTQADVSTTRKFGGSGLGLAICKQIVDGMGGTIGVESEPGEGSTFWFSLQIPKQTDLVPLQPTDHALAGARVLLVDDHPSTAEFLQSELAAWKMPNTRVEAATAALEALREAVQEKAPFSFVIIDLAQPETDGLQLARSIKAEPEIAGVRLILLAPRGRKLSESELHAAGISQCRLKPVRQSALFDCLAHAISDGAPLLETMASATAAEVTPRRKERILVAEDNAVNQKVAIRQLAKLGYSADAVANGWEVLEALERVPYDLILMDCQMPEMDGYEAAAAIRRNRLGPGHLRIIAMTANAMTGDREHCLAAGMDDYISKPIRTKELASVLERVERQADRHPAREALDPRRIVELRSLPGDEGGNALEELVELFRTTGPRLLETMREALEREDAKAVATAAHSLKSSSGQFGAFQLQEVCSELERQGRLGNCAPLGKLLDSAAAELSRTLEALDAELETAVS
jgi:PAS domain S-box-containing protein